VDLAFTSTHSYFGNFNLCSSSFKKLKFLTDDFWYKTFSKTVDSAETCEVEKSTTDSLVIFINVEKEDEDQKDRVVKKAVNNIIWLVKKQVEIK
jgi:hypothetical protein